MMYADVYVDEPSDKIVDDWDFLERESAAQLWLPSGR